MADWFCGGEEIQRRLASSATLSAIASDLADKTYPNTPHIHNELVNHESISGNSVKARKELMYQMLGKYGEVRLGYSGFSSDAGLFYSVIELNNLYQLVGNEWMFVTTDKDDDWAKHFSPIWEAADNLLKEDKGSVTLTEIYEAWQAPPIGARKGILPILALPDGLWFAEGVKVVTVEYATVAVEGAHITAPGFLPNPSLYVLNPDE